jgi:hypothetical protein
VAYIEPLASAKAKLGQAGKDLDAFEVEAKGYTQNEALSKETQPGHYVFRLRVYQEPPDRLGLLAGNAIQNMRSALDHIFWAWAEHVVGAGSPRFSLMEKKLQFPIVINATEIETTVKGLGFGSAEEWAIIERVQPYHGEKALGVLRDLSNVGKHRFVHQFRGLVNQGHFVPIPPLGAIIHWETGPLVDGAIVTPSK